MYIVFKKYLTKSVARISSFTKDRMTLQEYFLSQPRGAKGKFAVELGISATWLALILAKGDKKRLPSVHLCAAIEKLTKKQVKRKELRPDIFNV